MPYVEIDEWHLQEFRKEALANLNREICGVLVGRFLTPPGALAEDVEVSIQEVILIDNIEKNPLAAFTMEPHKLLQVHEDAIANGFHIVGCIHSHPLWSQAYSGTDISMAKRNKEEAVWLIYGGRTNAYGAYYFDTTTAAFVDCDVNVLKEESSDNTN